MSNYRVEFLSGSISREDVVSEELISALCLDAARHQAAERLRLYSAASFKIYDHSGELLLDRPDLIVVATS